MFNIIVADYLEIQDGCIIEPLTLIFNPKSFKMGERSRIASFVRIIGYGEFIMQSQSFIALGCLIECSATFTLGERSCIGPRCTIYTHGNTGLIFNVHYPHKLEAVTIERDCWIGMTCTIYPGIRIGAHSIVFAGVVVATNVKPDKVIMPSRNSYVEENVNLLTLKVNDKVQLEAIDQVMQHYQRLSRNCHLSHNDDISVLDIPSKGKIVLLRNEQSIFDASHYNPEKTVVWRLKAIDTPTQLTTFTFSTLTISGTRTKLAETIASYLAFKEGIYFIYRD